MSTYLPSSFRSPWIQLHMYLLKHLGCNQMLSPLLSQDFLNPTTSYLLKGLSARKQPPTVTSAPSSKRDLIVLMASSERRQSSLSMFSIIVSGLTDISLWKSSKLANEPT